jgi:hypothetical protein
MEADERVTRRAVLLAISHRLLRLVTLRLRRVGALLVFLTLAGDETTLATSMCGAAT